MTFLLINLLVLAAVAATAVLAYAQVLHALLADHCPQIAAPGGTPAQSEQVARDLTAAVFRFAVPGDAPRFGGGAGAAHRDSRLCPAQRRRHSVRWPAW